MTVGIKGKLARIQSDELEKADEIFLATTAGGIMPVTEINDTVVGGGSPGPLTQRLYESYWELHDDPAYSTPVDYD